MLAFLVRKEGRGRMEGVELVAQCETVANTKEEKQFGAMF